MPPRYRRRYGQAQPLISSSALKGAAAGVCVTAAIAFALYGMSGSKPTPEMLPTQQQAKCYQAGFDDGLAVGGLVYTQGDVAARAQIDRNYRTRHARGKICDDLTN